MAAQTFQAQRLQDGDAIDYTPGADVPAGAVVMLGGLPLVAILSILANKLGALETEGAFKVVKDASVFVAGDPVYWNPTGNPVGGVAGTGAATSTAAGSYLMGFAMLGALTGGATVNVKIPSGNRSVTPTVPVATVAATGTIQGDAAPLASGFTLVTGADAAKGVKLPDLPAGSSVEIKNGAAAVLKVWPFAGDAINAGAADASFAMPANTSAVFRKYDAVTWYSTPLVPS